ncbi:AIPR family protein [Pseudomonas chlororaphis]|uniref:AIPR family protein n=1 Tax=Pseudomonas chlororaphis TaxID=587753 RepID=UPI001473E45F|nr:AIPR family protein [Pseudomonas chlororaphis]NNB43375.1 AIPR family protein [Pseudomonas chlororaphis]
MHDEILKSYVRDFSEQNSLDSRPEPEQFERFVNYCIISKQYPRDFNFEDLSVGGGGDSAIDGAAIIINGNIVQEPEEIDFFLTRNGSLNVSFSFIQSKTSTKFNGAQIVNFLAGIRNFFSNKSTIPENEDIQKLRSIKQRIYRHSIDIEGAPSLDLFFVTTGKWEDPKHISGLISNELQALQDRKLFSEINFQCIDAERLKQIYREVRGRSLKEVDFPSLVALPEINGVRQSFVGSLSASEYLKLITDSDGGLQRNLFYDNVRDFQGQNSVNKEIATTLKSGLGQAALAIYNNGITIIAKKVERISDKVKLTDYQIVNGCQTSHVLFANKDVIDPGSHIVVKIIETVDSEIAVNVIKATNRQTEVKVEAFESLAPFHKDLEEYYKARAANRRHPIYYERRSKQYDNIPGIKNSQVITLSAQIKAFVSACLAQPQSTHRYFGEVLDSNRDRMFVAGDGLERYYVAAAILNRLENLFKRNQIKRKYKSFKYHLIFLLYNYFTLTNTHRGKPNLDAILDSLDNNTTLLPLVQAGTKSIESALQKLRISSEDGVRSKALTDTLAKELSLPMTTG